ncbi:restriction endonuclease subunit S [Streptomyces sp. NPDC050164]|uniref:restriction endonuclease subunit S n=1 Tax=Streptomyces sp. NPDC050164 TaxID=3365605 RepID=UPI0037B36432
MTTDSGAGPGGSGSGGDATDAGGLPVGWGRATLGELCQPIEKVLPTELGRSTFQYVDIGSIDPSALSVVGAVETEVDAAPSRARQLLRHGDTVFSTVRPYLRKIAWIPEEFDGEIASTGFCVLRAGEAIDRRFLFHLVSSSGFIARVVEKQRGVSYPAVRERDVLEIAVPVPPLAEQHRIVAKLDEQLVFIGAGEGALGVADAKGGHFLQAVLHDALRGKLAPEDLSEGDAQVLVPDSVALDGGPWDIPDGWRWATIGKLFKVAVGSTPSRGNSAYWGGDVPWVSSGEVSFARISSTRESITVDSITSPEARIHPPGTVMIAMIGEGRTRGQAAILDIPAAHNQNCASIRVSETAILPEFVYYFLMARYEETRREASGGNQPALNKWKVQNLEIPIPPLGTQRNIVARVQELEEDLRGLREAVTDGWARASKLRNALLHAAFTGALMPQDADDEPASVLLDRIRAQRSAEVRPSRRKRASRTTAPAAPQSSGRPIPSGTQEALPL